MPTTPSAKTKSPRGSSGRDEALEQMVVDNETYQRMAASENPDTPELKAQDSVSGPEDVSPADASGDRVDRPAMSPADQKLATRMTKEIAKHLGLSGRSRSVRV